MLMPTLPTATTRVESLAEMLEDDIRGRGLRPGDRYLTAAEASQQFSVSSMMVNRAMRMLADRDRLVRHRSRGTFVGPKSQQVAEHNHHFEVVHLMLAMDLHDTNSFSGVDVVDSVRAALPGVVVQVHYIPDISSESHFHRTIDRLEGAQGTEGVILIRCSRQVQHLIEKSGVAATIYGRAYPGINLSWVDQDQEQIGRMLGEFILRRGFRRCALITRCLWRFGDNVMLDSLLNALSVGDFGLNDMQTRSVPLDQDTIDAVVAELLDRGELPLAFVCRNSAYAKSVVGAIERLGRQLGDELAVVSGSSYPDREPARFSHIMAILSLREQMSQAATLLCESMEKKSPRSIVLPLTFQEAINTAMSYKVESSVASFRRNIQEPDALQSPWLSD